MKKWGRRSSSSTSSSSSSSSSTYVRGAYHAGSWYDSDPSTLDDTLSSYLQNATDDAATATANAISHPPRGIIAPHAGYSYSGSTAAHAYAALGEALEFSNEKSNRITTVVILHPSHHVHLDGCAISNATEIETPLGNLMVDSDLREEMLQLKLQKHPFQLMTQTVDEREHSGEMQYPYIAKMFTDHHHHKGLNGNVNSNASKNERQQQQHLLRVLPIMVGAISGEKEQRYGELLAPFLVQEHVFTVVSSDFCHWGKRFGFAPTSPPDHIQKPRDVTEIHQYIEWMDRLGMDEIASQEPGAFAKYIRLYKNTICGRHPIAVYLWALRTNTESGSENVNVSFVKYAQSSRVIHSHDSSVSYASAVVRRLGEYCT